jgi:hypothetical protein
MYCACGTVHERDAWEYGMAWIVDVGHGAWRDGDMCSVIKSMSVISVFDCVASHALFRVV